METSFAGLSDAGVLFILSWIRLEKLSEVSMQIRVIGIGKMKDASLQHLVDDYAKRISPFAKVEVIEVKDEANEHTEREAEVQQVKDKEAARVLEKIRPGDFVILLDLHGRECTSEEFASRLAAWQLQSSTLTFVIAGSLGPGEALVSRANVRWKLSSLTFTHLMTRVLLLEQIYRAFMINAGRTYHK